jgi:quercetin dioxygenase-like cupin family protein
MNMIQVEHVFCGGIYAKKTTIPSGLELGQHEHNFDHLSVLAKGRVKVTVDGESKEYKAGDCVEIAAGKVHRVETITDTIWYCIHASDCVDEHDIDKTLIKEK